MHGVVRPSPVLHEPPQLGIGRRLRNLVRAHLAFFLIVIVPSLIVTLYFGLIASNQYASEAHVIVRSADGPPATQSGLSQLLSLGSGAQPAAADAIGVADYLTSHDVVQSLRANLGLVDVYRRPGVDWFSRLWSADPTPERLLSYYLSRTKVEYDRDTGILTVEARAFRPDDAHRIASALMLLGDRRVNSLNEQSYLDAIKASSRQLREAEQALQVAQNDISRFRQTRRDIDPEGTGRAQTTLVTALTQSLALAQAQLQGMGSLVSRTSPQYVALQRRVAALQQQVAAQSGKLAGDGQTIASRVANYEDLTLRQQFAAKRYEAAATAVQGAREQALKKRLYLVRIVQPNQPVKALYPKRGKIILTVFIALLLTYGIGWLIFAGVKEHSA